MLPDILSELVTIAMSEQVSQENFQICRDAIKNICDKIKDFPAEMKNKVFGSIINFVIHDFEIV